MAIAFAGTAEFGARILEGLLDGPGDGRPGRAVALVASQPDRPAGRGKRLTSPPVAQLARERGLELVQPERLHEAELLRRYGELDIETFVVAAFGQMVREPLLGRYLMLNVHGSLLPALRGAAPVERAIMEGLGETGVGIMRMEAGLDTGPVARERAVPIGVDDDAGDIYARLARVGVTLLHDALEDAEAGQLEFRAQPSDGVTYAHKIDAADRALGLEQPARAVHDRVRALSPHVGAWLHIDGERLGIWRTAACADEVSGRGASQVAGDAGAVWHDAQRLVLGCAEGAVEVLELQPPGKRRMPAADWLRGLRTPLQRATTPTLDRA